MMDRARAIKSSQFAILIIVCNIIIGCADMDMNMNYAQRGTAGGAVLGGAGGLLASKLLCKDNDMACRNRTILAGAITGGAIGYITGQEKDVQIAQQAAEELRRQGYNAQITMNTVDVEVPYDKVSNEEISNEKLPTYPKERIAQRKKQVQSLARVTVPLKNRNDAAERAQVSNYLLAKANQMNGRHELVIPADSPRAERAAIAQTAKQQNVLVRESGGANSISLASL
jgi:hypothetical protein